MKRMLALMTAAVALAACSGPTAPSDSGPEAAKARAALDAAAKVALAAGTSARIAFN
jgi:hypothetical protein